jgi:multidrug efflux pump subunit AcrA (membrane-fusion protein)
LRVNQAARELRDDDVDELEERYERKIKTLEERLRSARVALEKQEANARLRKQDALLSAGETVFSLFSGRRRSISAAARKVSQISTSKASIDAAEEKVEVLERDIEELKQDLKGETSEIVERWEGMLEEFEDLVIKPRRTDIEVTLFALTWVPHWYLEYKTGNITQTSIVPAYKQQR